jgi:long-chain acyl-CoA synthetase
MPVSLCDAFQTTAAIDHSAVALRTPDDAAAITWGDYRDRVRAIATGLAALGVARNDTVALMLTNRPEFHLVDTAALHLGAIPFSIYNTSSPEQLRHILGNAESNVVITERSFLKALRASGVERKHIVCVDGDEPETLSLNNLERMRAPGFDFDKAWRLVSARDVATLIYTSGTTGAPKAVEITHANLLAQVEAPSRGARPHPRHPVRRPSHLLSALCAHRRSTRQPLHPNRARNADHRCCRHEHHRRRGA